MEPMGLRPDRLLHLVDVVLLQEGLSALLPVGSLALLEVPRPHGWELMRRRALKQKRRQRFDPIGADP